MHALVFSDSHGRVNPMLDAVEIYRPDVIFHLGDTLRDADQVRAAFSKIPFYMVPGNAPGDMARTDCEKERVVRLEGKTVFFLHGHTQRVKLGRTHAVEKAKALGADLMLYGHTHVPMESDYDTLLAVNPGAIEDGRCALLTWAAGGEIQRLPLFL